MNTIQIIIILISILLVSKFLFGEEKENKEWGFKDVVKDPSYWKKINESEKQFEEAVEKALNWSDEEISKFVDWFIFEVEVGDKAWNERKLLWRLGKKTHKRILEILQDKSLFKKLSNVTKVDHKNEAPISRALEILDQEPPHEVIPLLRPFLEVADETVRKDVMFCIGKTGSPESLPLIIKALDDVERVRTYSLMGLEYHLSRTKARTWEKGIFDKALTIFKKDGIESKKAGEVLFRCDPERGEELFQSDNYFSADNPVIDDVVSVLFSHDVKVPRDKVLVLISGIEKKGFTYPFDYALGDTLNLLALHKNKDDLKLIEKYMEHENETIAERASYALLSLYDLYNFDSKIWKIKDKSGYQALNQDQKYYLACYMCDAEINNGGLAQYFLNSYSNNWKDALAGFKAMGDNERFVILKKASEFFGKEGPSINRTARNEELSKIYTKNDEAFDSLDDAYYDCKKAFGYTSSKFVINNPNSFK